MAPASRPTEPAKPVAVSSSVTNTQNSHNGSELAASRWALEPETPVTAWVEPSPNANIPSMSVGTNVSASVVQAQQRLGDSTVSAARSRGIQLGSPEEPANRVGPVMKMQHFLKAKSVQASRTLDFSSLDIFTPATESEPRKDVEYYGHSISSGEEGRIASELDPQTNPTPKLHMSPAENTTTAQERPSSTQLPATTMQPDNELAEEL